MVSLHLALRSGWNIAKIVTMIVLGGSLISCVPAQKLAITPTAAPYPTGTPALSATEGMTAISIATPTFISTDLSTKPAPALLVTPSMLTLIAGKISSFHFGNERGIDLSLDDHYLYWAGTKNNGYIFRMAINGDTPEKIAASTYAGGRLDLINPILSGKWLIFADTNTPNEPDTWKIRALNLDDHSERLVLDIKHDTTGLLGSFNMSADGDYLVWTLALPESSEDSISMLNLATGEKREVLREKTNGSIWSISSFSQGQAVVEKDFDAQHGGGTNIYLLDLASGKTQALSTDGKSDMPHFVYPWVMWKAGPRFDFASAIGIYNLQTGQKELVHLQGETPSDPLMDGAYVYWTTLSSSAADKEIGSIYIFDILKNTTYTLNSSGDDQIFDAVAIHGKSICWLRVTNASFANSDSYLECTTIQ